MTLLIYEGKKSEDLFLRDDTIPDPSSIDNAECPNHHQALTKGWRDGLAEEKFNKCMGVSEEI